MSSPPGKRKKQRPVRYRYILVALAAVVPFLVTGTAFAGNLSPSKAAVCKYVGKPGVNERLQTGNNPIVVDRKSWMQIGSYFQDAQGRSYVLAFLNPGDPEPDVSQCPPPDSGPSSVTPTAPTTTQPSCNDPNETVTPPNQTGVTWSPSGATVLKPGDSVTYTASPANGYTFPQGAQTSFTESNTFDPQTCQQPPISVTPVAPTTTAPSCQTPDETVTPSTQAGVIWTPSGTTTLHPGDSVTYVATPDKGYVFPHGAQTSFTVTNTFDPQTCNQPPPTDVCPNIPGNQATVPPGMIKNANGDCVTPTPPPATDVCPNLPGNQATVPAGMVKDAAGNCVTPTTPPPPTDVCPNKPGVQTTGPCSAPPPPKHHTHHATCPAGDTWFDTNHNGKVDKGECVPATSAETGLGPIAPVGNSVQPRSGGDAGLPFGLGGFVVVSLIALAGLRKRALSAR